MTQQVATIDQVVGWGHDALAKGDLARAKNCFEQVRRQQPGNPAANEGLGDVALRAAQPGVAAALYIEALQHKAAPLAMYKLGLALRDLAAWWDARSVFAWLQEQRFVAPAGQPLLDELYDAATRACRDAYFAKYQCDPDVDFPETDKVFRHEGRVLSEDEAMDLVNAEAKRAGPQGSPFFAELNRRYLQVWRLHPASRTNMAMMLAFLRDFSGARREFLFSLWHWPTNGSILSSWADFHCQLGQAKHVVVAANLATLFQPHQFTGWSVLGRTIHESGNRLDSAENAYRRALALRPGDWGVLNNLNSVLQRKGRLEDTIPIYRELMERRPDNSMVWNNYLLALQYANGFSADEVAAEHRRYGEIFEPRLRAQWGNWRNQRDPERKLRVGFLSPDLRSHSVAYFVEPLWAELPRDEFDIVGYHNLPAEDPVSERLKQSCSLWRNVSGLDDDDLARQIRDDGIDILIDLAGHTGRNRLLVFARKPAPVQVTWLGHPNTTGLKAMDWRLTDAIGDPPGVEPRYTEKLWRLPDVFVVYRPLIRAPSLQHSEQYAVQPTPAVQNGYVTFGTCNNLAKLTPPVVALWSRVLQRLPSAKLLIEAPGLNQPQFVEDITARFRAHGVPAEQLLLVGRDPKKQYLRYNEIDIALDPFPCNGGTTTCDLLWMGVPIITLPGDGFMSRMGASLAAAVGHLEWVAADEADYLEKAVALATDVEALNRHRLQARAEIEKSPLRDEQRFARHVADALRNMWRDWCAGPAGGTDGAGPLAQARESLQQGRLAQARQQFDAALKKQPGDPGALAGLAEVALAVQQPAVAAEYFLQALQKGIDPDSLRGLGEAMTRMSAVWEARACLAWLLRQQAADKPGRSAVQERYDALTVQARALYTDSYGVAPEDDFPRGARRGTQIQEAQAEQRLAGLLQQAGPQGSEEARTLADLILQDYPGNIATRLDLAAMLMLSGDYNNAQRHLLYLLMQHPANADVMVAWVNLHLLSGQPKAMVVMAQLATMFAPGMYQAWSALGQVLDAAAHLDAAEAAHRRALALQPGDWRVQNNLCSVLMQMGRFADAMPLYRAVLERDGDKAQAWNNYLLALQYAPGFSADAVAAEHRRFGERFGPRYAASHAPFGNARDASRRLRVGFVSADLRHHSVAYFVEPLWAALPRDEIEIVAYCCNREEDPVSARLQQYCSQWHRVSRHSDEDLYQQIRADGIDILVDLAGHTAGNRLLVFARKPAPVQVTWLGHPNTTGLAAIDWRLTDAVADPPGVEPRYSEQLWRLPQTFVAYRPLIKAPDRVHDARYAVQPAPAVQNGYVTFGSCNTLARLTPEVVALWSRILLALPTARLLLEAPGLDQPDLCEDVLARFQAHGVAADRMRLLERDSTQQYLRYHEIDIALDPFPCNGGTTTCDLLWMGLPLVTLAGDGFMARMGTSLVTAAGHPEWIVPDAEAYVAKALALASDVQALNRQRLQARDAIERSPLRDEASFGRAVADAFRGMWQRWCATTYTSAPETEPRKANSP